MIEPAMYLGIGFLVASLLGSFSFPWSMPAPCG